MVIYAINVTITNIMENGYNHKKEFLFYIYNCILALNLNHYIFDC